MKKKLELEIDGNKKVIYVGSPTRRQQEKAKIVGNLAFKNSLKSGCFLKKELHKELVDRGVLTKDEEQSIASLSAALDAGKMVLKKGGIELEEAKKIAIDMRRKRIELFRITVKINEHEPYTAEGQSDSAFFDALVSQCAQFDDGKPVFESYDDYLEKSELDYAIEIAKAFSALHYGTSDDWEKELPENKFLLEYKFVNNDLHFVRSDGKLVDSENRLVDKDGRYINEDGQYINIAGERVDDEGEIIVESSPFLKDGVPV